jgi:ubiquinone/menaquinone biosynthesis C-methylase UbiE
MDALSSEFTSRVAEQYDLYQSSLEALDRPQKYLNFGYTLARGEPLEQRQQRLCLEVFRAAAFAPEHVIIDVGFGSGEQDFLLARTAPFARLTGFNIAPRQVAYASARAKRESLDDKMEFRHGAAEDLSGIADASVDRVMAIECAFYFDRPLFYRRSAEVLKPGGRLIVADMTWANRLRWLTRRSDKMKRIGTRASNRAEWEKYFHTVSVVDISKLTWPGAQLVATQIVRYIGRHIRQAQGAERAEWLRMAVTSEIVALGLATGLMHYDMIVLEKPAAAP